MKAVLVLLIASAMVISSMADKSYKKAPEVSKKAPVLAKGPLPPPVRPHGLHAPRRHRQLPFIGNYRISPRAHHLAHKFPLYKALSKSARKNRKLKVQKRKRVQQNLKHLSKPHSKKPTKVHNFARFLKAFGKQLNRPVQYSKLATSIANNQRRKYNIPKGKRHPKHPIVFKKAEDIAGYEKFTLDEVIYPEDKFDDKKVEKVEVKMTFFLFP